MRNVVASPLQPGCTAPPGHVPQVPVDLPTWGKTLISLLKTILLLPYAPEHLLVKVNQVAKWFFPSESSCRGSEQLRSKESCPPSFPPAVQTWRCILELNYLYLIQWCTVHSIDSLVFNVAHDVLEPFSHGISLNFTVKPLPLTPKDLVWQVRSPSLSRVPCGLDDPLQKGEWAQRRTKTQHNTTTTLTKTPIKKWHNQRRWHH